MADQLRIYNPHLDGQPIPRSTTLDEYFATVERRERNADDCGCYYCMMTEDDVAKYRQDIRGKHGVKEPA